MRTPIVAANWKMHKTRSESMEFLNQFVPAVRDIVGLEIVLGPPFTSLELLSSELADTEIELCAQNIFYKRSGAFTGEISPPMLTDLECDYVIVGHSERRNIFEESDTMINDKVAAVCDHGMIPILCIGEKEEERSAGRTEEVLSEQLEQDLDRIEPQRVESMIIAYEPIWAIGTGESASPADAQGGCAFIREKVAELFGSQVAERVRLQYGGSIKSHNAEQLMSQPDIDGGLVGSASLDPEHFAEIVSITADLST